MSFGDTVDGMKCCAAIVAMPKCYAATAAPALQHERLFVALQRPAPQAAIRGGVRFFHSGSQLNLSSHRPIDSDLYGTSVR
jgi:hypothetical protein